MGSLLLCGVLTTQILYVWGLFHLQIVLYRENPKHKEFQGGRLKGPKIPYAGILYVFYPAPQKHYIHQKKLGELVFGSLHNLHVIHCASRNYACRATILCVVDGVGYYIEKVRGKSISGHYIKCM